MSWPTWARCGVLLALLVAQSCAIGSPSDEWGMYQRDAVHDGYTPNTLLMNQLAFAWSKQAQPSGTPVKAIAASTTTIFTTGLTNGINKTLNARSIVDGHSLWTVPFAFQGRISEPAYDNGLVWLIENVYDTLYPQVTGGYLDAFDAATGARIYHLYYASNSEANDAPTIANGHVYFSVPSLNQLGGWFASVSEATGQFDWMSQSPAGDGRVPSVYNGVVYGFTTMLNELSQADGSTIVSIPNPNDTADGSSGRAPVFAGNTAFVTQGSQVDAFDLTVPDYAWGLDHYASGQMATDGEEIFYLSTGALSVHDAATGALTWGWEAPAQGPVNPGNLSDNLVVTKSHVIVTDGVDIYFINRATHREETSFQVSGVLAYAADTLFVGDISGIVTAFRIPSDEIFHGSFE